MNLPFSRKTRVIVYGMICALMVITGLYVYILKNYSPQNASPNVDSSTPYNTYFDVVDGSCFEIKWETKKNSIGYVKYGTSPDSIINMGKEDGDLSFSTSHKIKVCDLSNNTKYYATVVSDGVEYGLNGQPMEIEM